VPAKKTPRPRLEKLELDRESLGELAESEADAPKGGAAPVSHMPPCPTRFCTMACPSDICGASGKCKS
jgi:hypothetical protein